MEVKLIKNEKNDIEFMVDNSTLVEVLRGYLYKEGADFAAWRREHPSKPFLMKIQSSDKSAKKVLTEAIASIKKDCDKIVASVKK